MVESYKIPLPSYEELKKNIDQLLLIENWDNYKIKSSPKKFERRLNELFSGKLGVFPQIFTVMRSEDFSFPFYRLRKDIRSMNKSLISEYSYPPNNLVKTTQRANIPFHPVFYCCDHPKTAILETLRTEKKINPSTNYFLSKWSLKTGIELRVTPFLFGNLHNDSPYKLMSDDNFKKIEKTLSGYNEDEINSFKKIMRFLSHLFIYDNSYAVSSFIAHSYLYAAHNMRTDIFMYPSYQSERTQVNFAIHPNVVIEKMCLKCVYKINIQKLDVEKGYCSLTTTHIGKNEDSILSWEHVSKLNDTQLEELKNVFK
jgi:hypothetical protein